MTPRRALAIVAAIGAGAFALLPWYAVAVSLADLSIPALVANRRTASALFQVALFDRWSLAVAPLALGLACWAASARSAWGPHWSMCCAAAGFAWVIADASRALQVPHAGLGLGAAVLLACLVLAAGMALSRTHGSFAGQPLNSCIALATAAALLLLVAYPLARGLSSAFLADGAQAGVTFLARLRSERNWGLACLSSGANCGVVWNTLFLGLLTAAGTTVLGTLLALADVRAGWRGAAAIRALAPLPFVAPPFMAALALVLMFGRGGLVPQALQNAFDLPAGRGLYGLPGLLVSQLMAFSPATYLIIRTALVGANPAIEESARSMGASPGTILARVTLPMLSRALGQAFLLGFVESVADFGTPIVVGASYNVLSTEIYFAIVGAQFETGRAAALAVLLSCISVGVFAAERHLVRDRDPAAAATWRDGAPGLLPRGVRVLACAVGALWVTLTVVCYAGATGSAFVEAWGRNFEPTLRHVQLVFGIAHEASGWRLTGLGWTSLFTSLRLSAVAAVLAALAGLAIAWLLHTCPFPGRRAVQLLAFAALAVPGTVLGLCYMLVFDAPPIVLTGTQLVIVLCFVFRCLPVCVGVSTTALRDLGTTLRDASRVAGAGDGATLAHVYLPLLRHAASTVLIYAFVRSMTTVSAVIFLVNAETELATTFIISRVGQDGYGEAFAYGAAVMLLLGLFVALASWWGAGRPVRRNLRAHPYLRAMPS